jgi:Outer membrane cobalamin receptor protein
MTAQSSASVFLIGLVCVLGSSQLSAQKVRVRVLDATTDAPLPTATVTALVNDSVLIGGFTGATGFIALTLTNQKAVSIVARHIGFSPARTAIIFSADSVVSVTLKLNKLGNVLATVVANGDNECRDFSSGSTQISRVWENIRSALDANRLTQDGGLIRMEIERYAQTLDSKLVHSSPRASTRREVRSGQPFAAAVPSELEDHGYVISSGDSLIYFAPDARTLLSDNFARSHCFFLRQGSAVDSGMIGLAFEPRPDIATANVSGTLWVDARTGALNRLLYDYVNTGLPVSTTGTGGRIDFQQLPGGAWIITHWYIRAPRLARFERVTRPYFIRQVIDTLLGFREIGGNARPLGPGEFVTRTDTTSDVAVSAAALPGDSSFPDCSPIETGEGVTIRGAIRDNRGLPANGSKLVVEWSTASLSSGNTKLATAATRGQIIEVEPATNGLYSVCGLPLGVDYRLHFTVAGRRVADTVIQSVSTPQIVNVDFVPLIIGNQVPAGSTLLGLVRDDAQPARPIPNAEVRIQNLIARTDSSGRFTLTGVPSGNQSVVVRRVGFVQLRTSVDFSGPKPLGRIFVLSPTRTELDTVEVRANRVLPYFEGFEDRRLHGVGSYITRARFEKERDRKTSDILRSLPGLRVVTMTGGDAAVASARSDGQLGTASKGGDASDKARGAGKACYVQIFVDGVRVFAPAPGAPLFNINTLTPNVIEGVEYYRGPAETPVQYTTSQSECGTLLIWTRRGDQSR